jgi:hypothetical protein
MRGWCMFVVFLFPFILFGVILHILGLFSCILEGWTNVLQYRCHWSLVFLFEIR